jgi:hypothetical protein
MECDLSSKGSRGFRIKVLELKNKCHLGKWLDKLMNENGVWQELLRNKYLHSKTLSQVLVQYTDYPFWKDLMRVKKFLLEVLSIYVMV